MAPQLVHELRFDPRASRHIIQLCGLTDEQIYPLEVILPRLLRLVALRPGGFRLFARSPASILSLRFVGCAEARLRPAGRIATREEK
jgi:hypothetical protein